MDHQEHQITPSPELVKQWINNTKSPGCVDVHLPDWEQRLATQAARWGADQELEACMEWLEHQWILKTRVELIPSLRAARRKPPSFKQQALALINGCTDPHGDHLDDAALDIIRRALESLSDD